MTEARCPLVREIEPKFLSGNVVPVERASITRDEWDRLRAALEAAEDLAEHAEREHCIDVDGYDDECPDCQRIDRYRAATRKP